MAPFFYMVYTVVHGLLFRTMRRLRQLPQDPPPRTILLMAVMMGMIYENFILATGFVVGEGKMLEALNLARFWFDAFYTPLLIVVVLEFLRRAEFPWVNHKATRAIVWVFAIGLIIFGVIEANSVQLTAVEVDGVLLYSASETPNIHLVYLITALVTTIGGILLLKPARRPWLFLAGLVMISVYAPQISDLEPHLLAAVDVFLMFFFTLTERRAQDLGYDIKATEMKSRLDFLDESDEEENEESETD